MESLITLKQALDAGLITTEDYDGAKTAFLRAQQIRSGFESGLLSKADYDVVKASFLTSLGSADGVPTPLPPVSAAPLPRVPSGGGGGGFGGGAARASAPAAARPAPAAAPAAPPPAPPQAAPPPPPQQPPPPPQRAASSAPASAVTADAAGGCCPGKSLSGIAVTEQCVALYTELKSKSAYRFLTFKIDAAGGKVVPDQQSAASSSFVDFADALPEHDCRYGVYDFDYVNADGCQFKKLIFVMWSPDAAAIKAKMMYASTKDFFKGLLPGIAIELQATEPSEVDEADMRTRIQATLTRK